MYTRPYNFYAGPAALPLEVLEQAKAELTDFRGIGLSLMEISHRSSEYETLHNETLQLFNELLQLPKGYQVLLLPGGGSLQFTMIPMNFITPGKIANYVMTGFWANKAIKEAQHVGEVYVSYSGDSNHFTKMPSLVEIETHPETDAYMHITTNETVNGTQFHNYPAFVHVPLIADMSSDILSRPIDISKFSLVYAGAQKNLGPSGVTVVILREEFVTNHSNKLPDMLSYKTFMKHNSMYNTPPTFSIYMMNLVLKWINKIGGLHVVEEHNEAKAKRIYDAIDHSGGYYIGIANPTSRSLMNVTFKLQNENLEEKFLQEAKANGFLGLEGHRSVGHIRVSIYNATEIKACIALTDFMQDFQNRNS